MRRLMYWGKADHARAFSMLDAIDRDLRAYVKELLDEYHEQEQPQRYYDILIGYWVQCVAHAAVFATRPGSEQPTARHTDTSLPVIADDLQFLLLMLGGRLREPIRVALDSAADIDFAADETVLRYGDSGSRLRSLLQRVLARIGSREGILVCAPYAKCSMWTWLRFVMGARRFVQWHELQAPVALPVRIDRKWRIAKARAVEIEPGNLLGAIKHLVPLLMPVVYLEGLQPLRQLARKLPIGRPRAFYTANALYHHPFFKILAAEHQHATLLLGHQHGGSFGMELRHAPEEYERSICDIFYTWGWGNAAHGTRVLSPPAFSRLRRPKRWKLLFCLGDFPQQDYRLQFFPAGAAAEPTVRSTLQFAATIAQADGGGRGMLIRPPSAEYGRGWLDTLRKTLPLAVVDALDGRALERFAASELVFHNYVSTGWLESIWLDVPTLALYDPDVYAFRDEVRPHIEAFERFGLLHRSGRPAAQLYLRIRDDVRGWWDQEDFRAARRDFAARYVRVSANWQREWTREFKWVLENRQALIGGRAQRASSSSPSLANVPATPHDEIYRHA